MKEEKVEQNLEQNTMMSTRKKIISFVIFLCIAIASVIAILSFNKSFSIQEFISFLKNASYLWIFLAFLSVFFYILLEGLSLVVICKSFGYKKKKKDGFFYSAADIYFSAITPSASGGQPASAYFMLKDGIPIPIITVALLYTLLMYSISIIVLAFFLFLLYPSAFFGFDFLAKVFIIVGFFFQFFLVLLFYALLYKKELLNRICSKVLKLLTKLHLIKNAEEKQEKLNNTMKKYQEASLMIKEKKGVLIRVFLLNLGQRIFQIATVVFVFLATKGSVSEALLVGAIESLVITGAYCAPIPGAIGVTDYLMLNGFKKLMPATAAVNLELLSRGISFYCCILICGVAVLVKFWLLKRSSKK